MSRRSPRTIRAKARGRWSTCWCQESAHDPRRAAPRFSPLFRAAVQPARALHGDAADPRPGLPFLADLSLPYLLRQGRQCGEPVLRGHRHRLQRQRQGLAPGGGARRLDVGHAAQGRARARRRLGAARRRPRRLREARPADVREALHGVPRRLQPPPAEPERLRQREEGHRARHRHRDLHPGARLAHPPLRAHLRVLPPRLDFQPRLRAPGVAQVRGDRAAVRRARARRRLVVLHQALPPVRLGGDARRRVHRAFLRFHVGGVDVPAVVLARARRGHAEELSMNRFILVLAAAIAGCTDPGAKPPAAPAADLAAGRAFAERECKGCHGLDGKSTAPAIPHLAAQREGYLLASLRAYKERKRMHAALKEIATQMSDADARNLSAYYAGQPAVKVAPGEGKIVSPYDRGKSLAAACSKCHGEDGNSTTPGIPGLAGQQPHYLVVAIQEYLAKERKAAPMHALLPGLSRVDKESLALYFASQMPAVRAAPAFGDPAAGEPLSAVCGGCHGSHGISFDTATPILAAQDARYLVSAIKAYRTTRQRETMRAYVSKLSERDIENIAA